MTTSARAKPGSKPGPKPRADTASITVRVRLTREQAERWKAAAECEVLSLSEFVRAAVEARIVGDG